MLQLILFLTGLFMLGFGGWEVRAQRLMRRHGVHAEGVVVRHEDTGTSDQDLARSYAAVISFRDEHGGPREFTSRVGSSSRRPAVGTQVPVVYLPHRPETARPSTFGYKVAAVGLSAGLGSLFLALAVVLTLR